MNLHTMVCTCVMLFVAVVGLVEGAVVIGQIENSE